MADGTKIEWTEATWNPITGCSVTSPGCTNCYAMKLAGTRLAHHKSRAGLTIDSKAGPVWNGQVRFNEQWLDQPLRWRRSRMIFVCAHGDLFHESVPDEWIDRVFAVMALAPQHTFQVLTKRSTRMREYLTGKHRPRAAVNPHNQEFDVQTCIRVSLGGLLPTKRNELGRPDMGHFLRSGTADRYGEADKRLFYNWPLPNVWLGVSVEDQQRADERVPDLLATPAAVRWLSCEPLLGAVDAARWLSAAPWELTCSSFSDVAGIRRSDMTGRPHEGIDWIVAGGESGPGARPMHPDWARSLRDQCAAAGVPFFWKQWGEWAPCEGDMPVRVGELPMMRVGKKRAGRLLDGVLHDAMPGDAGHG